MMMLKAQYRSKYRSQFRPLKKYLMTFIVMLLVVFLAPAYAVGDEAVQTGEVTASEVTGSETAENIVKEKKHFSYLSSENFTNKVNTQSNKNNSAGDSALNVSLGLLFILLLIFSMAWLLKKMGYSNQTGQGQLKIIAMLNLGPKEKLAVIQVGQQQLLIGVTATQINTLHVLDESLSVTDVSENIEASFAHKISGFLNNKPNKA